MMPPPTPCNTPRAEYACFPTPSGSVPIIEQVAPEALTELEVIRKVLADLDRKESTSQYYGETIEVHAYALCIAALENLVRDMEHGDG